MKHTYASLNSIALNFEVFVQLRMYEVEQSPLSDSIDITQYNYSRHLKSLQNYLIQNDALNESFIILLCIEVASDFNCNIVTVLSASSG